jgi:hypothetical protein
VKSIIAAAVQQRPFTTAAVCEAAVRAAARHNLVKAGAICQFASLSNRAFSEVAAAPGSSSSSSSSSDPIAAAASDSSSRDALLLQFALIMTQLKWATSSNGSISVFTCLFHQVSPACWAVVRLSKLIERSVGLNSDIWADSKPPTGSSSVQQQRERVQMMLPWIHLTGRCLFFAGSQLLLALQDSTAAQAPGLGDGSVILMGQVRHVVWG